MKKTILVVCGLLLMMGVSAWGPQEKTVPPRNKIAWNRAETGPTSALIDGMTAGMIGTTTGLIAGANGARYAANVPES